MRISKTQSLKKSNFHYRFLYIGRAIDLAVLLGFVEIVRMFPEFTKTSHI